MATIFYTLFFLPFTVNKVMYSSLPRDAMQARPMPSSLSVCPSVRLSVCHARVFCRNG